MGRTEKRAFANGDIFHVYNRGVEKRAIFLDDEDYLRFVHDLFEFNDQELTVNLYYYYVTKGQSSGVELPHMARGYQDRRPRKLLVDLLAFCLMPNHIHLMLRQRVKGGVSELLRKLGTGFTNFFNKKYDRVGSLFQGTYKCARLVTHQHLLHLPCYLHTNPLDLKFSKWRLNGISDARSAMRFLESYRWSSYPDYVGKKNFPSVTQRKFLVRVLGDAGAVKKEMKRWIEERSFDRVADVMIEKTI